METALYKHSYKHLSRPLSSLSVYNTGFQRCQAGYCWGPGIRDHFLIHYVTAGHGSFSVRGETFALSAGDMFLARPNETIHYIADHADPWTYCWVGFGGLDAIPLLSGTDFSQDTAVLHFDEDTPHTLLMDIYEARGSQPFHSLRLTGTLYLFLAWLQERSTKATKERPQAGEEYVRSACAFIAHNFASPISVTDIATHVGVCRSLLYRAFQEHLHTSPTVYLTRFRLRHACTLLALGQLSVKEIAYSVGFEDPLYFSRRFRKIIGCAPSEYAASDRKETPCPE